MMSGIEWVKISEMPPQNISLLVRMQLVGAVYDVAIFKGIMPDGERRWVMADINMDQKLITHWAMINDPEILDETT